MKAVRLEQFGGPEVLAVADVAIPQVRDGDVLVKVRHAGVNYIDVYMRDGSYARSHTYKTPLPLVIGMEGAGKVVALGEAVTRRLRIGQRVAYCLSSGSYAEYAAVPADKIVEVPDDVPDEIACALMLQGSTAHYLSHSAYALQPGQTCLVHAGAGGVGQLLIQLAKRRGARVLATVGTPEKAAIAKRLGADETILYRTTDFRESVMALTQGQGVDVVYDSVGRDTLPRSLHCLKRRGTCISFGASSGQPEPIQLLDLAEAGSVFVTRPHLADYLASAEERQWRADDLFAAYRVGKLCVAIDRVLPMADAALAHRQLQARATQGKMLLDIEGAAGGDAR